ncbi:MAG: endolytic transglycosylase MltG [Patescibacteria group bacterium]
MNRKLTIIGIIVVVFLGIILFLYTTYTSDINFKSNVSKNHGYIKFLVKPSEAQNSILNALKSNHVIKSVLAAKIYIDISNPFFVFQKGLYRIYNGENLKTFLDSFNKGPFYTTITLPSGLRIAEVANMIRNELSVNNPSYSFSITNFRYIAHNDAHSFSYTFLNQIPGNSLEGFLYPGTYEVPKNANAKYIINKELNSFENNVYIPYTKSQIANTDTLNFYQNIIIASIVRRETLYNQDKPLVANIFIRRHNAGIPLGSDATVQYMLGFDNSEQKWWRSNITAQDLSINSPYNTRLNAGLPPTPICSPGLVSIKSTFKSTPNPYWYFLSGKNGHLHYAITSQGQINNIQKYL